MLEFGKLHLFKIYGHKPPSLPSIETCLDYCGRLLIGLSVPCLALWQPCLCTKATGGTWKCKLWIWISFSGLPISELCHMWGACHDFGFCLHLSQTSEINWIHPHALLWCSETVLSLLVFSQPISQPVTITTTQAALLVNYLHVSLHQSSMILKSGLGGFPVSPTPAQEPSASCEALVIVHSVVLSVQTFLKDRYRVHSVYSYTSNTYFSSSSICGQLTDLLDEFSAESCQKHKDKQDAVPGLRNMS